jgi:hypothetical protein
MDIEKLKYLKKEVKILTKQYKAHCYRSDEAEKLWDVLRNDCEFLDEDDDACKHNLIKCKFPVACDPEVCPLA